MWIIAVLSNLLILPFLLIISIPLALFASATASLALITLYIRGLIVYFELASALLINVFFPADYSPPASASFLGLPEGSITPGGVDRTTSSKTLRRSHYYHDDKVDARYSSTIKPWKRREPWISKEDYFFHKHNYFKHGSTVMASYNVLSSFLSSNAERNFEETVPQQQSGDYHRHNQPSSSSSQKPRFHRRSKTTPVASKKRAPSIGSSSPLTTTATAREQRNRAQQLQTSVSNGDFNSTVSRPSSTSHDSSSISLPNTPAWYDLPLLMTTTDLGGDYRTTHHPGFSSRRRRSSGSSPTASKAISLMGL